jgi:hypothetical protein
MEGMKIGTKPQTRRDSSRRPSKFIVIAREKELQELENKIILKGYIIYSVHEVLFR